MKENFVEEPDKGEKPPAWKGRRDLKVGDKIRCKKKEFYGAHGEITKVELPGQMAHYTVKWSNGVVGIGSNRSVELPEYYISDKAKEKAAKPPRKDKPPRKRVRNSDPKNVPKPKRKKNNEDHDDDSSDFDSS